MTDDVKEPINVRLGQDYKRALEELARDRNRTVSSVVREVLQDFVDAERRRAWEAEARRSARVLAEEAEDPDSPEAETLRTLEANLEEFAQEWVWEEED
ncbi:MAG: ribbon-helix-helix protein, CopG family [Gemmatimonadota bacterium]